MSIAAKASRLQDNDTARRAVLLVLRMACVSLLYFLTITIVLALGGKQVVAGFVEVQNQCYIISSFASLGFYSILMFYASRSASLARWSLWQMLAWAPAGAAICVIGAAAAEAWSPSVGAWWLAFFAFAFTVSTSITGLTLGQGRLSLYTAIEIGGAALFLGLVCAVPGLAGDAFRLNLGYALIAFAKFAIYLATAGRGPVALPQLSWRNHRSRRLPSIPLIRRFGGPSWLAGTLYIVTYRLMLMIFQGSQGIAAADLAVCWAIFDRLQMIVQVVNTLTFRKVAQNLQSARKVVGMSDRIYPIAASLTLMLAGGGIAVWTRLSGSPVAVGALAMGMVFFGWGYRAILQNVLTASRSYEVIVKDLALLLVFWLAIMAAQRVVGLSWPVVVASTFALVILSALRLRRQILDQGAPALG